MSRILGKSFSIPRGISELYPISGKPSSSSATAPLSIPTSLTISLKQFVLAAGRAVCSRSAPASLIDAQKKAIFASIGACCGFSGGTLNVTRVVETLNETKRNAIAHDLGVGVTYLLMQQLGYPWAGLAEDHITPSVRNGYDSAARPDMIFDSGRGSTEVAAVEAKGTVAQRTMYSSSQFKTRLKRACKKQIGNVLGHQTTKKSLISRGLVVGCEAPAGARSSHFHVLEAWSGAFPSPSIHPLSAGISFPDGNAPLSLIAARHYLGILRLIDAHDLGDRFKEYLGNRFTSPQPFYSPQRLRRFSGRMFLVSNPIDFAQYGFSNGDVPIRFGLDLELLRILTRLLDLPLLEYPESDSRFDLPVGEFTTLYEETVNSESNSFVNFDGSALLDDRDTEAIERVEP